MTFETLFMGHDAPLSHMTYEIGLSQDNDGGDTCKLTIEHFDITPGQEAFAEDWARLAASLKSFLETGNPLKAAM